VPIIFIFIYKISDKVRLITVFLSHNVDVHLMHLHVASVACVYTLQFFLYNLANLHECIYLPLCVLDSLSVCRVLARLFLFGFTSRRALGSG